MDVSDCFKSFHTSFMMSLMNDIAVNAGRFRHGKKQKTTSNKDLVLPKDLANIIDKPCEK